MTMRLQLGGRAWERNSPRPFITNDDNNDDDDDAR